jgi:hypothetical protein
MRDLKDRLSHRVQLTSDGHKSYLDAVERAFGSEIDYAMLVKHYGPAPEGAQRRYSPAECIGFTIDYVTGSPERKHVSTSYVERQNLFHADGHSPLYPPDQRFQQESPKPHLHAGHLLHALQLRSHSHDPARTPAMAAGVSKTLWSMDDIVKVVEEWEAAQ